MYIAETYPVFFLCKKINRNFRIKKIFKIIPSQRNDINFKMYPASVFRYKVLNNHHTKTQHGKS